MASHLACGYINIMKGTKQMNIQNTSSHKPIILALEGLDGSGKTIQSSLLYNHIKDMGKTILMLDFPQYNSFFGTEIGAMLSGKNAGLTAMDIDSKSMCLWYALDRHSTLLRHDWQEYDYILFNRYTLSNAVYQTARKYHEINRDFINWIFELEYNQLKLPIPDLYIFLETPVKDSKNNVLKKEGRTYVNGFDVYEQSSSLLSCCRQIYLKLAETEKNIHILPCCEETGQMLPPEKIQEQIISIIKEKGLLFE